MYILIKSVCNSNLMRIDNFTRIVIIFNQWPLIDCRVKQLGRGFRVIFVSFFSNGNRRNVTRLIARLHRIIKGYDQIREDRWERIISRRRGVVTDNVVPGIPSRRAIFHVSRFGYRPGYTWVSSGNRRRSSKARGTATACTTLVQKR